MRLFYSVYIFLLLLITVATLPTYAQSAAARVSDNAFSPLVVGPVVCVGGQILPPGASTVLIEGLPAARVTDLAQTICGAQSIIGGSNTVLIEGLRAARVGDITSHGGIITGPGANTVVIGQ